MSAEKRSEMIFLLKSDGVRITSVHSSSAMGSQSENHVLIAVGVSCEESVFKISFQMSIREFTEGSPLSSNEVKTIALYYTRFAVNMQ